MVRKWYKLNLAKLRTDLIFVINVVIASQAISIVVKIKGALYIIWCGVNRLGDTSAFVIPAGQPLLTRRGKTRMYTVGIEIEFYTVPV